MVMAKLNRLNKNQGMSLIEVILAVGLFSLFATALIGLLMISYSTNLQVSQKDQASYYLQEGLDATTSIRRQAWNYLINGDHGLNKETGYWQFVDQSDQIDDIYNRVVNVSDACRGLLGSLVDCEQPDAKIDLYTKKITVNITYTAITGVGNDLEASTYLTAWQTKDWVQTDWSTGSGQTIWSNPAGYDTDSETVDFAVSGEVKLSKISNFGTWNSSGGNQIIETSDADFSAGSFNQTAVFGAGELGGVKMNQGIFWSANKDSRVATLINIRAVDMVSATDGWAEGDNGIILRYDGNSWVLFADLGTLSIRTIKMVSATDGRAAGTGGKIYRFNGEIWQEAITTGTQTWYSIDMLSANNGWLSGNSGQIYHYDGEAWTKFIDTGSQAWYSIDMLSATDGWVSGNAGYIYHFDGVSWTQSIDTGSQAWYAINMVSATDGWAVGNAGYIYHYTNYFNKTGTFFSQIFDSGKDDTIWNSINWSQNLSTGSKITLAVRTGLTAIPDETWSDFTVELLNSDSSAIVLPAGRYAQYRATFTTGSDPNISPELTDVTLIYDKPTTQILNDLAVVDNQNIWAVGNAGTIVHYDGSHWLAVDSSTTVNLRGVAMPAPNDGWAVGDSGKILHYDGQNWSEYIDFGSVSLRSIYMISTVEGWAVGNSGRIYYYNSSGWTQFADTGTQTWYAIAMVSDSDGWVIGNGGEIYRYNGAIWEQSIDTGDQVWYSISALTSDNIWISGSAGYVYHFDGEAWTQFTDTGSQAWYAITMVSEDDGWLIGNGGRIYHFDGANWTPFTDTGNQAWYAIEMDSPAEGWAVGNNGEVIYFSRSVVGFEKNGWLISSAFKMPSPSAVNIINWNCQLPVNTDIKLQVRTAPDVGGVPGAWTGWSGFSGVGNYFTDNQGQLMPLSLNFNQWIQYRLELSGDGGTTPVLEEIKINYLP